MRRLISAALLLIVLSAASLAGDSAPPAPASSVSSNDHGDTVLKAMLAELKRSQEKLQLGQMQRPRSEERRVGKECRSLCDWSSDVCSSDLVFRFVQRPWRHGIKSHARGIEAIAGKITARPDAEAEIGRASCRERV